MNGGNLRMISVFTYLDYREYLRDVFVEQKELRRTFSHRAFARMAGFSSSNYVLLVMQDKRNLSSEGIQKVARGLKLKKREAEFFENLVRFNQAKSDAEKNFYYGRIAANRKYAESRPLEKEQYEYYSRWYVPAIRELVLLDDFREDPKWIAERISPAITPREAKEALDLLLEMNLITRGENGRIMQTHRHISGGDEVASLAMKNFQREMIELAAKSIERTPHKKREIGSLTFAISRERLAEAKKLMRDFRSKLAGFIAEGEKPEAIYQFNMQLFNLSKIEKEG